MKTVLFVIAIVRKALITCGLHDLWVCMVKKKTPESSSTFNDYLCEMETDLSTQTKQQGYLELQFL